MTGQQGLNFFEFLNSEPVRLCTPGSPRSFSIHKELLGSKCKTIYTALNNNWTESEKGLYTCSETTDGTLSRFIEWAYTGDYPDVIKFTNAAKEGLSTTTAAPSKVNDTQNENQNHDTKEIDVVTRTQASDMENHPLIAHLRLYIFCKFYIVEQLQPLAFKKLTACLTELDQPQNLNTQLAVISVLQLAFSEIATDDDLLDWLAHYASYCLDRLLLQPSFHDLLHALPALSSHMIMTLKPAPDAPWDVRQPKYRFPHYKPAYDSD